MFLRRKKIKLKTQERWEELTSSKEQEKTLPTTSAEELTKLLKDELGNYEDFVSRKVETQGQVIMVYYLSLLVETDIVNEDILRSIIRSEKVIEEVSDLFSVITSNKLSVEKDYKKIVSSIRKGFSFVFL
ncbi:spore germination protein [Bacillus carboniphilus]|uniref:Spore germination protein n=1 Tax=Bacillus carboniphilus TaxID=86663 RepID=A0ABY9JXI8_9BACI|nr:spore germination protein [Bacillus carboniphilus]WLR43155.1 spore germination protein [Bacillus carboniphilus]